MAEKPNLKVDRPGHILILDEQWHKLFAGNKPIKIQMLEKKLTKLLKEQGKVNTEYEGYKKLKKQMMDQIVANMNNESHDAVDMKQKNSRYIKDINRKFEHFEKRKSELPAEIDETNSQLLSEGLFVCYKKMLDAKKQSATMDETITRLKSELTKLVGEKEDNDQLIARAYGFMHDVAGFEAIEKLDRYFSEEK